MLADPAVSEALREAWADSRPDEAEAPHGSATRKREQGGWIIWNSVSGAYRVERVGEGTRDALPSIVGTRPSVAHPEYLVGWFYTHPNTVSEGYAQQPSPSDRRFTRTYARVPGCLGSSEPVDVTTSSPTPEGGHTSPWGRRQSILYSHRDREGDRMVAHSSEPAPATPAGAQDTRDESLALAAQYLERTLQVPTAEYELAYDGLDDATGCHVVSATHRDDLAEERGSFPGAGSGKSRLILVDLQARGVKQVLHWQ